MEILGRQLKKKVQITWTKQLLKMSMASFYNGHLGRNGMTHWFLFTDPPHNVFITASMINISHEQPPWGAVCSPWGCFLVFLLHRMYIATCTEEWSGILCPCLQLCLQTQIFIVILGKSCSSSRSLPHLQNERDGLDNFLGFIWCRHFLICDSKWGYTCS